MEYLIETAAGASAYWFGAAALFVSVTFMTRYAARLVAQKRQRVLRT